MSVRRVFITLIVAAAAALPVAVTPVAGAVSTCTFSVSGTTMKLNGDCTTDSTIVVPGGFTLDGAGRTITALDPSGGHFVGAVVANGGTTAHVRKLTVTASGLANVCDAGANRLRGILFEGASGSIVDNVVLNINQGVSGCQEGNGIEVRNAPFDGTHPNTKIVSIKGNRVANFQKTGVIANGDIFATIEHNTVIGLGPVNFIAQNGIQIGFGGLGVVRDNEVSKAKFTPQTFGSGGVLIFAGGANIQIQHNKVDALDVGVWVAGANNATVSHNKASNSTFDGIALDNQGGSVNGNTVAQNQSEDSDVGIGLYGANNNVLDKNKAEGNSSAGLFVGFGSTGNTLSGNHAEENGGDGISVKASANTITDNHANENGGIGIAIDGSGNVVQKNHARENGVSDIQNIGANSYAKNKCNSSSGPPVDCGASPSFPLRPVGAAPVVDPYN